MSLWETALRGMGYEGATSHFVISPRFRFCLSVSQALRLTKLFLLHGINRLSSMESGQKIVVVKTGVGFVVAALEKLPSRLLLFVHCILLRYCSLFNNARLIVCVGNIFLCLLCSLIFPITTQQYRAEQCYNNLLVPRQKSFWKMSILITKITKQACQQPKFPSNDL